MTFNPTDQPRAQDGKFSQKLGASAEVALVPTSESRAGSFARARTFDDVNDQFEGLTSPENLYMDGEASPAYARQRLGAYTANYATRLVEISNETSASEYLHYAVHAVKGASSPSEVGKGTRVGYVNAGGNGSSVTAFIGGRPEAEVSGRETVLIDSTHGGRLLVKSGADVLVGVTEGSEVTVEFEEGASGRLVTAGHTTLIGNGNVELVGYAKGRS